MLYFVNDYCEGAHPAILQKLLETNMEKLSGYGTDKYCDSAKEKIRKACSCPDAEVYFLVGGTQTNATIIASVLNRYEGVLAAQTGHVGCHEAGAKCNRVIDMQSDSLNGILEQAAAEFVHGKVFDVDASFYGICKECLKKEEKQS